MEVKGCSDLEKKALLGGWDGLWILEAQYWLWKGGGITIIYPCSLQRYQLWGLQSPLTQVLSLSPHSVCEGQGGQPL